MESVEHLHDVQNERWITQLILSDWRMTAYASNYGVFNGVVPGDTVIDIDEPGQIFTSDPFD